MNDNSASPAGTTEAHVRAEHVEISQGGVSSIDATTVNLQQGGAGRVRATDMSVSQGGVGLARAQHLRLQDGASAFAVVADDASLADGSNVVVLIARTVTGDVRPLLDWRAAAAFGAAFGLALRLLRRR